MKEALYAIQKNRTGYDFAKVWDHGTKDVLIKLLADEKYNMYCGPVNKVGKLREICIAPIAPMCLVEWNK